MEKKKLRKDIGEEKTFDAEIYKPTPTTIDEVLQWLNEAKEQGATHIYWYARAYDGDSNEVEGQAYLEYEETDEECLAGKQRKRSNEKKKLPNNCNMRKSNTNCLNKSLRVENNFYFLNRNVQYENEM